MPQALPAGRCLMLNILLQAPMIPGEAAAAGAIEATPDRAYQRQ